MPVTVRAAFYGLPAARARAVVFGPVTPSWDEGEFFAPVIRRLLLAGMRVTVVDSLAVPASAAASQSAFLSYWRRVLPSLGPFDVLCGNALGGALVQGLLPDLHAPVPVLLVSGPSRADALLNARLAEIAGLAAAGRTRSALRLLALRVLPEGEALAAQPASAAAEPPGCAASRLAQGLRLLYDWDAADAVRAYTGPLLHILGGRSQLVAPRHAVHGPGHRVHVVPWAGMRPHTESPAEIAAVLDDFLHREVLV